MENFKISDAFNWDKSIDWAWATVERLAILVSGYTADPKSIYGICNKIDDQLNTYLFDRSDEAKIRRTLALHEPLTEIYRKVSKGKINFEGSKVEIVKSLREKDPFSFYSDEELSDLARCKDEIDFDKNNNILGPKQKADEVIGQLIDCSRSSIRDFRKSNSPKHKSLHFTDLGIHSVKNSKPYDLSFIKTVLQQVCGVSDEDAEAAVKALRSKDRASSNKKPVISTLNVTELGQEKT